MKDTYKTIIKASEEILYKDKNSKFFGYAFPISNEEQAKEHLEKLRKKHHQAGHFCYAWQMGKEENGRHFRANDDGEPGNSAGMPIYGQIQSFEVTNLIIVIVRYFGGTKLGMGGLIQAYKTAAQLTLENSKIVNRTINDHFLIKFDYPEMSVVMRIIKENDLDVINQELGLDCKITIKVRRKLSEKIFQKFETVYKVDIKKISDLIS